MGRKKKIEREKIEMSSIDILELWDKLYHIGDSTEVNGETFKTIHIENTSEFSDGESWDYIVERQSDGKFFKFHVWDAGYHNGFIVEDEYLEEVFKTLKVAYE